MTLHYPTIYRKDTGRIIHTGSISCSAEYVELNFAARLSIYGAEDHGLIDAEADPEIHYVTVLDDKPTLADRPEIPYQVDKTTITAGGVDFLTISGLHSPCDVIVDDPDPLVETTTTTVTGGSFEFAAEDPGLYTIQISRSPFLPMTLEITAEEEDPPL